MLELVNVFKSYGAIKQRQVVLENVCWSFELGHFTVLLGKSGAGKSTVLNLLSGLDQPDSGSVIYDNIDIYSRTDASLSNIRKEKFGFIFQSFNLISSLTAYENIEYPLYLLGENSISRKEKTIKILKELEIADFADSLPSQLSGGQRQRVAIGRALVKSPNIIFADEPTANLDEKTGEEIVLLLQKLQKQTGTTIVYVTHDLDILKKADKSLYLTNRKIELYDRAHHSN
jgi:putative ABC transport system ATP-binding protein